MFSLIFTLLVGNMSFSGAEGILNAAYSRISCGIVQTSNTSASISETALTDAMFQKYKDSPENSSLQVLWIAMNTAMIFLPSLVSVS